MLSIRLSLAQVGWKWKERKYVPETNNNNKKRDEVTVIEKQDSKAKLLGETSYKKRRLNPPKNIIIINIYSFNFRAPKYLRQNWQN